MSTKRRKFVLLILTIGNSYIWCQIGYRLHIYQQNKRVEETLEALDLFYFDRGQF